MDNGVHGGSGEDFSVFIGRERELGELLRLAAGTRALTLSGTGGIGKTRLALRLMAELAPGFPDGAWFVGLADLGEPDLVVARIATAIGVVEEPGRPLSATLADAIRPRRMLICLDTCEHLIEECARVCQRLLASAPGLRVITTSREPLRVAGETTWQVPPLSMPPGPAEDDQLLDCDALRLFAERAVEANPEFALSHANLAPVAAICRELDGLPLAIELAAAWVRALSVEQIAARLDGKFRLLSSAERTGPARHRTLRAAIDWSHDLLPRSERVLFRRLSVFAGWPLEMAEQVCAGTAGGADLAAKDILNLLTSLADKSLVVAETDAWGAVRYRMLDTIREYAAERLAAAGGTAVMQARFRDYGVREMERLARIGMALEDAPWSARVASFRRFAAETPNIRQILSRCLADGDAESGLRICASTRPVWIVQGTFAEGIRWIDGFLGLDTSALPDSVLGRGLVSRAQLGLANDPAQASQFAKAGLDLCRDPGAEFWAASALNLLAEAALHAGQSAEAAARAGEALDVAAQAGDRFNESYATGTLATLAAFGGDLAQARRLGEQALAIARDIDQLWAAARAHLGLGDLARLTGDPEGARQDYSAALTILRDLEARPEMARCLAGLGRIALSQGDVGQARRYLRESIEFSRATGSRVGVIRGLEAFAALAVAEQAPDLAVRLTAAAAALRSGAGLPDASSSRTQRALEAAAGLGEETVARLWAAGQALGSEAAIALALGDGATGPGGHAAAQPAAGGQGGVVLTPREREIAVLIAGGLTNRAIAAELVISPATVARHIANVMAKLSVSSRVQVAAWALGQNGRNSQGGQHAQGAGNGDATDRGTAR